MRSAPQRDLVVVEVVTASGLTGMGYLHLLTPALQRTIGAASTRPSSRASSAATRPRSRRIWRDALARDADRRPWRRHDDGAVGASTSRCGTWSARRPDCRCIGSGAITAAIPAYGSGCFRGALGDGMVAKAKHYAAQGFKAIKMQAAHIGDLATDLETSADARGGRPGRRDHDRRQHGLDRRPRDPDGPQVPGFDVYWLEEPVLADDFAGYLRIAEALTCASSAARRISAAPT